MSFGVTMQVKNLFFDRAHVVREVGKLNAAALSKIGAFVRRRARRSMRRRKGPSAPGQPPSVHSTGAASLKNILFAYEPRNMSVVIGPVLLSRRGGDSIPALHEFGGRGRGRKLIRTTGKGRARKELRGKEQQLTYPPRPFMGPALAAEAPNFPSLWVSSAGARAA